jgi:hypothetical protein
MLATGSLCDPPIPRCLLLDKADSLSGLASRPLFAVKETSLLDIAIYVCAS